MTIIFLYTWQSRFGGTFFAVLQHGGTFLAVLQMYGCSFIAVLQYVGTTDVWLFSFSGAAVCLYYRCMAIFIGDTGDWSNVLVVLQ